MKMKILMLNLRVGWRKRAKKTKKKKSLNQVSSSGEMMGMKVLQMLLIFLLVCPNNKLKLKNLNRIKYIFTMILLNNIYNLLTLHNKSQFNNNSNCFTKLPRIRMWLLLIKPLNSLIIKNKNFLTFLMPLMLIIIITLIV